MLIHLPASPVDSPACLVNDLMAHRIKGVKMWSKGRLIL